MKLNLLRALIALSLPFGLFVQVCDAQTDMQQRIISQSGTTAKGRLADAATSVAVEGGGAGLRMVPADFAKLKLAPGCLLKLNVLDDSDYAGAFRIDEQGDIAVPVLGILHVAGKTVSEARHQITQQLLDDKVLKDPQVDLSILEYSAPEVTILGEVANPGKYPLLASRKLLDVLALGGGTTMSAGNEVQITSSRADIKPIEVHYSKATDPKAVENVIVQPGDTVQVKRAGIVYVLGAVTRPGGYVMQEEGTLTVLQAISLANGTAITASTRTIYLLRRNADGTEVKITLPYKKIAHGEHADMNLQATDLLYVPPSAIKEAFTDSQGILASATSASIYAVAIH